MTKQHSPHSSARRGGGRGTALPPIGNINVVNVRRDLREHADRRQRERTPRGGAGRWSAARRMGLSRHERPDRPPAGALRIEPVRRLRDAVVPVLTTDCAARRVDARARSGDRLHLQRRRRSAATAAPGTSGSPPTPRSTASTTCPRSPGTGRRTATSARRPLVVDHPPPRLDAPVCAGRRSASAGSGLPLSAKSEVDGSPAPGPGVVVCRQTSRSLRLGPLWRTALA